MRFSIHTLLQKRSLFLTSKTHYSHAFARSFTRSCTSAAAMPTRSDPQYEYIMYDDIEDVEDIACYCPGGLYLLQMYDVIQDRYRIVHKLGHGGYSTVWLCWDMKTARYVAMKIGAADVGCTDIDVLSRIRASPLVGAKKGHDIGKRLIPKILGQTTINGPNGIHPCLITAPAMGSLSVGVGTFKLPVVRSICAQLAMGVEYLHSRGYVHGGAYSGYWILSPLLVSCLTKCQIFIWETYFYGIQESTAYLSSNFMMRSVSHTLCVSPDSMECRRTHLVFQITSTLRFGSGKIARTSLSQRPGLSCLTLERPFVRRQNHDWRHSRYHILNRQRHTSSLLHLCRFHQMYGAWDVSCGGLPGYTTYYVLGHCVRRMALWTEWIR